MAELKVAGVTDVIIADGLPDPVIPHRASRRRAVILTQPAAADRATLIRESLEQQSLTVEVVVLPDREEAKTLKVAASVYDGLVRFGLSRDDTVIGVGGGSVTDLAGFVAGTWLRGVEVIHFPTTLLGSVDASIGGKTGVNLAGKNLVGVIWHPSRVIVDVELLESLPLYLKREGMAEIYKSGLVGDPGLAMVLASHGLDAPLDDVVRRAIAVKALLVSEDDREHGVRAFLNFGHTIGHAIELASPFSHGESVSLGMIAASRVSERLLGFTKADVVRSTLASMGLPTTTSGLDTSRVQDLLKMDKKRDSGGLRMVLLKRISEPHLGHVDQDDLRVGLSAVGL